MQPYQVYLLAISGALCFASGSLVFSHFAKKISSVWMNLIKALVSAVGFLIILGVQGELNFPLGPVPWLLLAGGLGLFLADILLVKSFTILGVGRGLLLFSFAPVFYGIYGHVFLGQTITSIQLVGMLCMFACLVSLVYERMKTSGEWQWAPFMMAFVAIFLDSSGMSLTRQMYENYKDLTPFQANFLRCLGAVLAFILLKIRDPGYYLRGLQAIRPRERAIVIVASLIGTCLALAFHLTSLKYAQMAGLASITLTAPLWATLVEIIFLKQKVHKSFIVGIGFFLIGFYCMVI